MAVCGLDDGAITDRQQQQIRERGMSAPAPYGVGQVRADVHVDRALLLKHDSLLAGPFAKRKGPPKLINRCPILGLTVDSQLYMSRPDM